MSWLAFKGDVWAPVKSFFTDLVSRKNHPETAGNGPHGPSRRVRIHHVYYVLAAFDLAAVVTGLWLTHHVNGVLANTVRGNLAWSALHDKVAGLRSGAGIVNTPGNNVFESKDPAHELQRFDSAVAAFWPRLEQLRTDVEQKVPAEASREPTAALDAVTGAIMEMVLQTRSLLSHYANGEVDAAAAEMAAMDRSYAVVLKQIETIAHVLRRIESTKGVAELQNVRKLHALEYLLGSMILLMVIAVTVYGHKLGKMFQRQFDELSLVNTKLKQHEGKLQAQNTQLDAAMNNMVQGLAMFDAERRLVICNKRFAELYSLTDEQVQPGTTLHQILEHQIAAGCVDDMTADELLDMLLAAGREETPCALELADGRHMTIAVQPMSDGGTVITHQDITEQRRSEAKIVHMALHDTLTGLPNRVLLNERMEQALTRMRRDEMVAAHFLDLDFFKNVNDTLGHPAGDRLLKAVAERLRALVRESDTVARLGGDEFAIVQAAIAQPADATALAQRIIDVVAEPYDIDGNQVIIGTSVGIAMGPGDGHSSDLLMKNADLALYRAKSDGRNAYRFFEPEMDAQMRARRAMEHDLRRALTAGEFELHYQPVVNLERNEITSFEALIRWNHPEKGTIAPNDFIPLAEEIGFIDQIGEWALRTACATAATWPRDFSVAVNISPVQFRNQRLVQVVFSALAASNLPAHRLELEITEAVLMKDAETTLATLLRLRDIGVKTALDDFGTGYSSLSYLQRFPFDRIKIDRSFIKYLGDGEGALNIVRAVASLAKGLGMAATAEGVETEEQLELVKSEGCTEMQGFLFSRPRRAHEIQRLFLAGDGKDAISAA